MNKELIDVSKYDSFPSDIYTLYVKKNDKKTKEHVEILVLSNEDKSIAYGPDKLVGLVSWYDSHQLIVNEYPEMIKDKRSTSKYVYYIHILSAKKVYDPIEKI